MATSTVPLNRAERRRALTRAALIAAARRLFAERGVEATTIQQIAEVADVAKGSFYNHFHSREEILAAVAAETLEELGRALDREVHEREADPARVVAASLLATLRACVEDPTLGGFVLKTDGVARVAEGALGRRGRRDFERGRASGRFQIDDLEAAVTAAGGATHALLARRLTGELDETADTTLVALVLRMLGLGVEESQAIAAETAAIHRSTP